VSHVGKNNIGAFLAARQSLVPTNSAAGVRNGVSIDRTGFASCVVVHACAAVTGAPTSQAIDLKLQDSADGTTFTDVVGFALTQKTSAVADIRELDLNLAGARQFVRLVETVAFVGGATPAVVSAPVLILGGADKVSAV
jgi:hypothetical protein